MRFNGFALVMASVTRCSLIKIEKTRQQLIYTTMPSVLISYANRYSIDGKAILDMEVGNETGLVASNSVNLLNIQPGTLCLVKHGSNRFLQIVEITGRGSDDDKYAWQRRGGKIWKNVYKMKPLTEICKLTKLRKIIVNELTSGKDTEFWNPKLHSSISWNPSIIRHLIDELNGE